MRELVYLSAAKLGQFQQKPDRLGGLSGSIGLKANPGALPTAEVALNYDPANKAKGRQAQGEDLDGIVETIRKTWPVRWWTEIDITPGEWIQFENRLNFGVIATGRTTEAAQTALLFWGNEQHDLSTSPRLLLHGSVNHLVPSDQGAAATPFPASRAYKFFGLFASNQMREVEAPLPQRPATRVPADEIEDAISSLSSQVPNEAAAWMSGLARVTVDYVHHDVRTVVASPLYVEYIPAPR